MPSKEQVIEILQTIEDPEIGVDIWTMGLIYDITLGKDNDIAIRMTFTSPMCPVGEQLKEEVIDGMKLLGLERVAVEVTFDPPWQPSAELKAALGLATV